MGRVLGEPKQSSKQDVHSAKIATGIRVKYSDTDLKQKTLYLISYK
jgi:hypothetical protein